MEAQQRVWKAALFNCTDELELNNVPLFKNLTCEEKIQLENSSTISRLKRGKIIYHEGRKLSGIYFILKGVIKIFKIGSLGKAQILRFAHQGNVIGYRSLLTGDLACSSAKVIEDATVCYVSNNTLFQLFEQNYCFRQQMMKMMCKELNESNSYVAEIAQKSVRERTAEELLYLQNEFGLDYKKNLRIKITRVELASKLGTAAESVIRVLTEFKKDGLIDLVGKQISILNPQRLKEISDYQIYRPHCKF